MKTAFASLVLVMMAVPALARENCTQHHARRTVVTRPAHRGLRVDPSTQGRCQPGQYEALGGCFWF